VSLILTAGRSNQPTGAVQLNRNHPLARGLVSLVSAGSGLLDLASGRIGTPTALSGGLTNLGKSWSFDGSTTLIDMNGLPPGLADLSGTYSMAAIGVANNKTSSRTIIQLRDASSRNTHICYIPNYVNVGMESAAASSGRAVAVANGRPYILVGSASNGAPTDVYVNGILGTDPGSAGITASTQTGYTLGKRIGSSSILGEVLLGAVWNRALSFEEKMLFTRNPWALFEPKRIWLDYPLAAGGGVSADGSVPSISLSAATGSATGASTASGDFSLLAIVSPSGAATGAAVVAASPAAFSLTAPTGTASTSGDVLATGGISPIVLSAPSGYATGAATADGVLSSQSLIAPSGTATGAAVAAASPAAFSLTAPTGAASTSGDVLATGGISPIVLSAPSGYATGAATASCVLSEIFLTSPLGNALAGTTPVIASRHRTIAGSSLKFARPASLSTRRRACR